MKFEIPQDKWAEFFNDLSKRRFGWATKVEVLNGNTGNQTLSEGMSLNGITFEEKSGHHEIEISVVENAARHQTHNLARPLKVSYLSESETYRGVVEIEDKTGTVTRVSLLNPLPLYVTYETYQLVAVA